MWFELSCVLCLTALTVVLHAAGTFRVLQRLLSSLQREEHASHFKLSMRRILWIIGALLLLHWLEAALWACFYWAFALLPDFETSMYFSLTSYSTLGYGDVVLPKTWRLVGPFEAAVGILMFGWSTGVMVAVVSRMYLRQLHTTDG
jgi:Ion channel.